MKKNLTLLFFLFLITAAAFPQEKKYKLACVAFYNVENLYDTLNDPQKNDDEFLPKAKTKWGKERYGTKLTHLSEAISGIGEEYSLGGPTILGLAEVENESVLQDLINTPKLKNNNYGIVHYDSPDARGVDVALLYRKNAFQVTSSKSVRLYISGKPDFASRDQLVVSGVLEGEKIHFIVNHWPSRRGGEKKSSPLREAAATLTRSLVDSLLKLDPNAKIMVMGDLNDDPVNKSVTTFLKTTGTQSEAKGSLLFNPMYDMFKKSGIGSLAYRDAWNLFDQIILSPGLLGSDKTNFTYLKAYVFNKNFLVQKEGSFAGYPFRTYVGGSFLGGYSDHFPVYVYIAKEK